MSETFMTQIKVGEFVPIDRITTIKNEVILLKGGSGLVHFQLRRFSGCPLCNVHMRFIANKLPEIEKAGLREIIVLHSEPEIILENQGEQEWSRGLNFVGDPEKTLYKLFGTKEASSFSIPSPRILKAIAQGKKFVSKFKRKGDNHGHKSKPMDSIIDTGTGKVLAIHYGKNIYDQWTVEELLAFIPK